LGAKIAAEPKKELSKTQGARHTKTHPDDRQRQPVNETQAQLLGIQFLDLPDFNLRESAGSRPFYSDRNAGASSGYESGLREMPAVVPANRVLRRNSG